MVADGTTHLLREVWVSCPVNPCLALVLLAMMVQSEAGGEPIHGKLAVAYVAVNRAESSGLPLETVLRQPRQFALNPRTTIDIASWIAAEAAMTHQYPDPSKGADHFYNPLVKPWPEWYDERYITVRIGRHAFLNLGGF